MPTAKYCEGERHVYTSHRIGIGIASDNQGRVFLYLFSVWTYWRFFWNVVFIPVYEDVLSTRSKQIIVEALFGMADTTFGKFPH